MLPMRRVGSSPETTRAAEKEVLPFCSKAQAGFNGTAASSSPAIGMRAAAEAACTATGTSFYTDTLQISAIGGHNPRGDDRAGKLASRAENSATRLSALAKGSTGGGREEDAGIVISFTHTIHDWKQRQCQQATAPSSRRGGGTQVR